ncbi:glucosamine-6-phosphate deaminase [Algibacter amylolyticus]|uniref:Glucosamine-6-phosphate deaminase n=1 Tax=Algibacter amylolyticus TaxID=1608400 RepID=A0A5M7B0P8_9FLAO|nr:glucosamine-6-phosphate deaminase [Algibacter amylolyticus]KAA5821848.1 glucosamine-6-phosphate deaminase [Algibacter amylolyticus]MBB5269355.1 glucosamine-6-phosphate deaminase [Algibacter amylolyticus]TSJ73132.1 glucosamine-6-phosphate deaminase [Algibacter amylolyticus]
MLKSNIDKATGFEKRFENIGTLVYESSTEASKAVAKEIAALIRVKQTQKQPCILGLATGSSPKGLYAELVRLHKEEGLSFKNVISFNLDEYYPMEPDSVNSYVRFMKEQLFNHVDILPENYHVPDGLLSKEDIANYCDAYEAKIEALGGIDLQVLGIGGNGHIGFNESGSLQNSKTRLVALDHITRVAASGDFSGLENTPRTAITLGVKKIMEAKRVILLAWGERKSNIIKVSTEGEVTSQVPASYLQEHNNATFILDQAAASKLTRINKPWLVEKIEWTDKLIRKAVLNLALDLKKPILMLTDADYIESGMSDLLADSGPAYDINIKIFNRLQNTITGWPGGKPNADDSKRPERAEPAKKRVLIFSPHPDDDIISMGGTFKRLHEQGHEVHVGYQTSGNIAVADDEALRFASFVCDFNDKFGISNTEAESIYKKAAQFLKNKKSSEIDTPEVRYIKGLIRKGEARATCHFIGIPDEQIHFMELPFYETGAIKKNPIGIGDVKITVDLIDKIKPHQIFAAGDLADPHGTHKVCLDTIFAAVRELKPKKYMKDCWVWLYRGAWQEWGIDEIEMAVPMGPDQVLEKRKGIFKHQSQKDGVVFQGTDSREFWQRAEDRNKETADLYDDLGLSHYAAMEAFVRWHY